jgi:membrane protein insertase Oxa1/YidC/SpoIIIJ
MDPATKAAYCVLPVLVVVSQYANIKLNQPPNMVQNWVTRTLTAFPILSGITALSSPAGIGVYWFANSIFSLV